MTAHGYTLRILHLSDLHEGQPGRETLWRRRRVLGDAWIKNLEVIAGGGRGIDLVCFTGDVAYAGGQQEYVRAADFVRELLRRLGLGPERFFAVPGNHDADRDIHPAAWRALRDRIDPRHDAETLSGWLAGGKPPRGIPAGAREQVLARGAAFRRWLHDLGREELLPEASPHGRLGYRHTLRLPGIGRIADILQARSQLDEALRIRLEEELPVYERLGDVHTLLLCQVEIALNLVARGQPEDRDEIARLLAEARAAAEGLGIPEAEQIRAIQRRLGL